VEKDSDAFRTKPLLRERRREKGRERKLAIWLVLSHVVALGIHHVFIRLCDGGNYKM
jgi:hypothetical protein